MPNPFSQAASRPFGVQALSAGISFPGAPPGNPLIWADFTDESTLWADTAGTIPITEGAAIQRIDNKGFHTEDMLDAGSTLEFRENILNGRSVARGPTVATIDFDAANLTLGIPAPGFSFAAVARILNAPTFDNIIDWAGAGNVGAAIWRTTAPNWSFAIGDPAVSNNDIGRVATPGEWVWFWGRYGLDGFSAQLSGATGFPEPTGGSFNFIVAPPNRFNFGEQVSEIPEAIWWDVELNNTQIINLIRYFTGKYGAFPQ